MRKILFRGKRIDNGEWIYGYLYRASEQLNPFIMLAGKSSESYEVDPDTVGQYTGLKDINGTKILEGDIVSIETANISVECDGYFVIKYEIETARFVCEGNGLIVDFDNVWSYCEVAVEGNVYDNPELFEEE